MKIRAQSILLPLLILLAATISAWPANTELSSGKAAFLISLGFIAIILHLIINLEKNWLRPDTIFIFGLVIVNYQLPAMMAFFAINPIYEFQAQSVRQYGNYAIWLSTLALISWLIGYAIKIPSQQKLISEKKINLSVINIVNGLMIFAFFISLLNSDFFSRSIYVSGGDGLIQTRRGIAAYLSDIVQVLTVLTVSAIAFNRIKIQKKFNKEISISPAEIASACIIFAYSIIFTLGGERGEVVQILLAFLLIYATNFRPIRFWVFIFIIIAGSVFFSIISIWRSGISDLEFDLFADFGYWMFTVNPAQSIITLTESVAINNYYGNYYGSLWISQILGIFPFAQFVFFSLTGWSLEDVSSAALITVFVLGQNATSGLGTSYVADLYLNFGSIGVIIFSAIFGMISRIIFAWLHAENGMLRFCVSVVFCSLIFYISRSSALFVLKLMLWTWLFLIIFLWFQNFILRFKK